MVENKIEDIYLLYDGNKIDANEKSACVKYRGKEMQTSTYKDKDRNIYNNEKINRSATSESNYESTNWIRYKNEPEDTLETK